MLSSSQLRTEFLAQKNINTTRIYQSFFESECHQSTNPFLTFDISCSSRTRGKSGVGKFVEGMMTHVSRFLCFYTTDVLHVSTLELSFCMRCSIRSLSWRLRGRNKQSKAKHIRTYAHYKYGKKWGKNRELDFSLEYSTFRVLWYRQHLFTYSWLIIIGQPLE